MENIAISRGFPDCFAIALLILVAHSPSQLRGMTAETAARLRRKFDRNLREKDLGSLLMKAPEKILVALSGGVDSSVAAALLKEQGHELVAAYMKNWINEDDIFGHCPWEEDIEDARAVADALGIEFRVVNLIEEYRERIVDYLLAGYQAGITPNPDVMCNREIKFGAFLDYAKQEGFAAVATGHYARNRQLADGTWDILEGSDPNKDQTYFLAMMQQDQAAHARFPVGELLKPEVREKAREHNLPTAEKKDSQGICFIGKIKMADFLAAYVKDEPGNIVNPEGKVLGQHRGLHYYTLGQRKGIGIASNIYKEFYVVIEKRVDGNELVIAIDRPDAPKLYARRCTISSLSWVNKPLSGEVDCLARPRYRAPAQALRVCMQADGTAELEFEKPQRALTPGQICALYQDDVLLGGGIFTSIDYTTTE